MLYKTASSTPFHLLYAKCKGSRKSATRLSNCDMYCQGHRAQVIHHPHCRLLWYWNNTRGFPQSRDWALRQNWLKMRNKMEQSSICFQQPWFVYRGQLPFARVCSLKLVLNWANVCSPNIHRTLRRTMIRFLIELLIRRTWFGQSRLYFVLKWLVMRCKLRPELAADAQRTAWAKM